VLDSFCYLLLRPHSPVRRFALALARLQRVGNRRTAARACNSATADTSSGDDDNRPHVLGGGEPAPAADALAILHDHPDNAAALASALGGEALDLSASCGAARDPAAGSRPGRASGARKPAVGIAAYGRRAQGAWRYGVGDHRAYMAAGRWARARRHSARRPLARIRTSALAQHARR
jgi:hypothetical protein